MVDIIIFLAALYWSMVHFSLADVIEYLLKINHDTLFSYYLLNCMPVLHLAKVLLNMCLAYLQVFKMNAFVKKVC